MPGTFFPVLDDYLTAFENSQEPFLFYYPSGMQNAAGKTELSRGNFLSLAKKAATTINYCGLSKGDCFSLCFGSNHPFDLVFRLGSVITGTVPVTINWQADSFERIVYKLNVTESKMVVTDSLFNPQHLAAIRKRYPHLPVVDVAQVNDHTELDESCFLTDLDAEGTRIVVFTSGTTGQPKGVRLPYRAYASNRLTFEQFLGIHPQDKFGVLIVNPMHHSNSTAITDWALRRPGSHLHLIEKYTTAYWKILTHVAARTYACLLAPTVSRHFDFLESLDQNNTLPVNVNQLKAAMQTTDFLIGSAPVGPTTIERLRRYAGRIPNVRFGSTETCLQVIGIPKNLSEHAKLAAFQKGWSYRIDGAPLPGYYIGRPHPPYTEVRIVGSITPGEYSYMQDCAVGRSGYLITRGDNLMSAYVKNPAESQAAFYDGWYTGMKDICFALRSDHDGELDYYWVSRESMLLIRGGANYAYDQINEELKNFICAHYRIPPDAFDLAVVGLRIDSEHEDSCCLTIEARSPAAEHKIDEIQQTLKIASKDSVSKGARPDYVRIGSIPRNFKGAVLIDELARDFKKWLQTK